MSQTLINQSHPDQDFISRTQRIYIDPQELILMKKKRKSFKMVKSIYEPGENEDYDLFDKHQWDKTTKCSSKLQQHMRNLSSSKLLSNRYSHFINLSPPQHIQSLQQIMENQIISPNVQFIWKLLPTWIKKQIIFYQQGDCIPFISSKVNKTDDKFLILSGQVKIIGKNSNSFKRKAGYLYFLSNQTKDKIKQIVVLRSTKILRIPSQIYQGIIKPYMSLKNTQRLNFIHMCPFFIWNEQLSEDLASCMQLILTEKEEIIYHSNQFADRIYFVKEGIVLLERNSTVRNSLIEGYEQHYEKTEISEKDVILVVRKGMVFGIDGVIIKEFEKLSLLIKQGDVQNLNLINEKDIFSSTTQTTPWFGKTDQSNERSNHRIYSARTLGKCELYSLDKKVLQTLFKINDIDQNFLIKKKKINAEELQRLSLQYMNMLGNQNGLGVSQIPLKKKQIVFNVENCMQQRSKSVASMENKSTSLIKISKTPSKSILSKRTLLQNHQLQMESTKQQQRVDYQKYSLNEERQINELRNRIRSQRQKLKLQSIRKSPNKIQTNNNPYDLIKQDHHFPKIFMNKQPKSVSNQQKPNQLQKKLRLDQIISKKLKQEMNINNFESKIDKLESIQVEKEKKTQKSQLVKLLEQQNIKNKSNPSFINVKAYKSISTVLKAGLKI